MDPTLPPNPPFVEPVVVQPKKSSGGKWILFGCGGCAVLLVVGALFCAGIFAIVMGSMRSSDVCTEALARASASAEVRALLGTPLTEGWMLSGNIDINGTEGTAKVSLPISGPKGGGTVQLEAKKKSGAWIFTTLLVTPDSTGKPIDLLTPAPAT